MSFGSRPALSVAVLICCLAVVGLLALVGARGVGSPSEPADGVPPGTARTPAGSARDRLFHTELDPRASAADEPGPLSMEAVSAPLPMLHGRLQLEGDGDPTSARIELLPAGEGPSQPADEPTSTRSFSPAPDGSFVFAQPARAPFSLRASAPGHVPTVWRGLLPGSGLHLFLPRSHRLGGSVRDARDGRPIVGASVVAETLRGVVVQRVSTVTDARGAFELQDVPEQIDHLHVEAAGFLPANVPALSSSAGSLLDVALIRSRLVLVRVIDGELGGPLADVVFSVPFEAEAELGLYRVQAPPASPAMGVRTLVEISCTGYLSVSTELTSGAPRSVAHSVAHEGDAAEPLDFGDPRVRLEIALRRSSWISGFVRSASGTPVADAHVLARVDHGPDVSDALRELTVATTSSPDGRFRVEGLPPGLSVSLVAWAVGWRPARASSLVCPEAGGLAGVELKLVTTPGVTGHVVDEAGQPVPGALIVAVQDLVRQEFLSDTQGRFELTLDGRLDWLGVMKPGYVPEIDGAVDLDALDDSELRVTLTTGLPLTGAVLDTSGQGVPWASAAIEALDGGQPRTMWPDGIVPWMTAADESGRYRFDGLAPGRYKIRAWKGDRVSQEGLRAEAGATNVDVVLPASTGLVGEVSWPPGVAPEGEIRVVYVPVDERRSRGTLWLPAGSSSFNLPLTGAHWLLAAAPGCGSSPWVLVTPGMESEAPLVLYLEPPGQLTGTFRDTDGRPVPAARLAAAVVPPDDSAGIVLEFWRGATDVSGAFAIDSLGSGCYRVGEVGRSRDRWRVCLAPGDRASVDLIRGTGTEKP